MDPQPPADRVYPDHVILTRSGLPKRRYSFEDKLNLLGLGASREATLSRLEEYQRLFAFRFKNAIVTLSGKGPRAWVALKGHLGHCELVRHLLANRLPGRPPIWYGSRSLKTSLYLCLDVDADKEEACKKQRLPFTDRCTLVERAFRRMGINPDNPRSVLIQITPRGGRHYYVFLDQVHFLDQIHDLLQEAGLRHSPGAIEFFPSTTHGFRLPFGYLPDRPHDPTAWIQFIDDYRNGRIIRHSLANLQENIFKHRASQYQRIESRHQAVQADIIEDRRELILGIPKQTKSDSSPPQPDIPPDKLARYEKLIKGIDSGAAADELITLGILVSGTRTKALMHLAAHLIWFKNLTGEEATEFLTEWAMDPRHVSKDIAADLANGTQIVAKHIATMCRWHEVNKKTPNLTPRESVNEFAREELDALLSTLIDLSLEGRINQAIFLLHFLRFAKRHGKATEDGSAWDAAPAVRQVVRRWPGCHHMNYKARFSHAISAGCMTVVKGAWHHSNGAGRATTYRLSVPVIPQVEWVFNYDTALAFLTTISPPVSPQGEANQETPSEEEPTHASNPDRSISGDPTRPDRGVLSSPVPPTCAGTDLDPRSRQCHSQPNAAPGLHRRDPKGMRTVAKEHAPHLSTGRELD